MDTQSETLSGLNAQFGPLLQSLSSIPTTPWEYLKYTTCGPDHQFPTIDTVTVPASATTGAMLVEIINKNQNHANVVLAAICGEEQPTLEKLQVLANPFVAFTEDKQPYIPETVPQKYVEFLEMINKIDTSSLQALDDPDVAKVLVDKILYSALSIS